MRFTFVQDEMPFDDIHRYLAGESYWAKNIPVNTLRRALGNSLCVCALSDGELIGFGRVITDRATFAYLADVFVLPAHRGRGVAKSMVRELLAHAELQGLRRWMLMTRDAHALYAQFGFVPLPDASRAMEKHNANAYQAPLEGA
jgi:N-acetylglutamate synthase-like GNAT family acetyltransferase